MRVLRRNSWTIVLYLLLACLLALARVVAPSDSDRATSSRWPSVCCPSRSRRLPRPSLSSRRHRSVGRPDDGLHQRDGRGPDERGQRGVCRRRGHLRAGPGSCRGRHQWRTRRGQPRPGHHRDARYVLRVGGRRTARPEQPRRRRRRMVQGPVQRVIPHRLAAQGVGARARARSRSYGCPCDGHVLACRCTRWAAIRSQPSGAAST